MQACVSALQCLISADSYMDVHHSNTICGVFKRGYKIRINAEVSKIGHHHFRKKSDLKIDVIKKCAPKLIFFNAKKKKIFDIIEKLL